MVDELLQYSVNSFKQFILQKPLGFLGVQVIQANPVKCVGIWANPN